jgi:hypothetical protein
LLWAIVNSLGAITTNAKCKRTGIANGCCVVV